MSQLRKISFYNSTETAPFLKKLIEEIESQSVYKCNENYSLPTNEYKNARTFLGKVKKRYKMYLGHSLHLIKRNNSSIKVCTTNPFFAPLLSAKFKNKNVKTINLVYDLYPDALEVAGMIKKDSIVSRLVSKITSNAIKSSDVNVFLGVRLRKHAESRYGQSKSSKIIHVGGDGSPFKDREKIFNHKADSIAILYCGQIGRMQDGEGIIKFLEHITSVQFNKIKATFYAYGPGYEELKKSIDASQAISINGAISNEVSYKEMMKSQVSLITLIPGAENVGMPSRTYTSMLAGQAILAICSKESDLADLVNKHDCGWVIDPNNIEEVKKALNEIQKPEILLAKRLNSYSAGHEFYDVSVLAKQ